MSLARTGSAFSAAFISLLIGYTTTAVAVDCPIKVADSSLLTPGEAVVSINPVSPPMQYVDPKSGELKGMRVEVGDAILERLCLKQKKIRVDDFGTMIPGLQAGRWDMINTGVFFTDARIKIIYMVRYENQAIAVSTRPGDAGKFNTVEDLAGKTIGVDIGGYEENKLKQLDQELQAKGLPAIKIAIFNDTNIDYQALKAGQVDANFTIEAVAKEYADRGISQVALKGLYPSPVALAFRNKDFAQAVADTLTKMKADGSYQAIFDKYGKTPWDGPFDVKGPGI